MSNLLQKCCIFSGGQRRHDKDCDECDSAPHSPFPRAPGGAGRGFQNIIFGKNLETNSDLCFHLKIRLISRDSIDLNMNNHIEGIIF